MGFQEAVSSCFSKYVSFEGRASRPEYWWWVLFVVVLGILLRIIGALVLGVDSGGGSVLSGLFYLATFLPGLAVAARRLHDTDRTGWWLLVAFIPVIGFLVLLYFMVQPGSTGPNQYGSAPATTYV